MKIISEKNIINEKKITNNKENNNYGIADTVCQIIINKIISKAIGQSNNNVIYSKLNKHCFNYMLNFIDSFLSTDFIFYENNNQNQNKKIFYSTIPQNILNTWVEIEEPDTPELDRYHSINIKIVKDSEITKNNENTTDNLVSKEKQEKALITKNIMRSGNKLNTLKENLEFDYHLNIKNMDIETKIVEENENKINEKSKKKINEFNLESERGRKSIKNLVIDLPCYDLPKEVYENKYIIMNSNEENNLLRFEREKDNINKEQQKLLEKIKNKKDYEKKLKSKLNKEFDSKKITFDSNGKIINLNIPNIDSFPNDFNISKQTITELKMGNITPYSFGKEIQEKISDKNLKLNKQNSANIIFLDNKNLKNNIKENFINKDIFKDAKFEKKMSHKINVISKFKVLKPSYSLKSINQKKPKITIEYNPILEEDKKTNPKIKIPPSGPNFDKIVPEIGVVIQNDNKIQVKKGGFEFYNKYNKPSIKEFSQLVEQTLKLNNQLITKSITTENIDNNKKLSKKNINTEQSDYNGYNPEFIENNNPLIQNAVEHISNIKIDNKYNNKSLIKNKSHIVYNSINNNKYKVFKSFDDKLNLKNKQLINSIKLSNKNMIPNLYHFLTTQDNNNEEKEENKNKNIFKTLKKRSFSNLYGFTKEINNNNNLYYLIPLQRGIYNSINNNDLPKIFKKKNNKQLNLLGEDFIDIFNTNILKNNNWGNNVFSEKNLGEVKNIFRKSTKINKLNKYKEIIGNRKRVPHIMNSIKYENK